MAAGRGCLKTLPPPIVVEDKIATRACDAGKKQWGRLGMTPAVVAAMWADYLRLKSCAKVAKIWGRTRQSVFEVFQTRGLPMTKKRPQVPVTYQGRKFTPHASGYLRETSGAREFMHLVMWRTERGPIPPGHEVMFLNADRGDCRIENLDCVTAAECRRRRRHENAATLARKEALVQGIERWLRMQARRLAMAFKVMEDDLYSEGRRRARQCANGWRPDGGAKFLTFAGRDISRYMRLEAQKLSRQVYVPAAKFFDTSISCQSLDAPVSEDDETTRGELFAVDGGNVTDEADATDRARMLQEVLAKLPERERAVLEARFFASETLEDIGGRMGVSRERVRQIEFAALKRIRKFSGLVERMVA